MKINKLKKFIKENKNVLFISIFILSFSIFLLMEMRIENDYLWHIKAGDYMLKNGILKEDIFSWTLKGHYWMSHEWLFEVIISLLKKVFGSFHLLVYGFVSIFSLLMISYLGNMKNYHKNILFTVIWMVFAIIFCPYMQGRPQLLSYILVSLTIYFLYDLYNNEDSKKIYFLPLISLIWANVHGGSSNLCYLFCFLFLIVGLFKFNAGKITSKRLSNKQLKKYLIFGIISFLVIMINPHGSKMITYPYINMMDSSMMGNISEWSSIDFNNPGHYFYLGYLVFIFMIMMISNKKISLIDLCLFGISVYLGLKSVRFWCYTYIIMNYVIFNYVNSRKNRYVYFLITALSIMLIAIFVKYRTNNLDKNYMYLNNEVFELIKKEKPKRLFNMYDYGGELIYNDIEVYIDSRADLYSGNFFDNYLVIANLNGDYKKIIEKNNFDYMLIGTKFKIYNYLKYNEDYELIYSKDGVLLYKKIVNN